MSNEKRLREVLRANNPGFWRIDGFGSDMLSVDIHPKSNRVSCYLGKTLLGTVQHPDASTRYALAAEIFESLM